MTTYDKLLDKIFNLNIHHIKLGLDNMNKAIDTLNLKDELNKIKFIHIAGTNGKGSTAAILNSLLISTSKNIGLYTSPHLITFNERIVVNNSKITDLEIVQISELIFKKCSNIKLTFFEFTTLICFIYFINKKVDIAVLEAGLGGRLDATNVINSYISIITSIGLDHTQYLGNTLGKIAKEKAGVFKDNSTIILAKTSQNKILIEAAKLKKTTKIYELENNFNFTINDDKSLNLYINMKLIYNNVFLALNGEHQFSNLSLALLAFHLMFPNINEVNTAISKTYWPARLEKLSINLKTIYIDVSHNPQGVSATIKYFKSNYANKKILIACGFMKDKDFIGMINQYLEIADKIFVFPTNIRGRDLSYDDLKNTFIDNTNIIIYKSIEEAIHDLLQTKEIGLISGSIYNIEKIYKILKNDYNYNYTI